MREMQKYQTESNNKYGIYEILFAIAQWLTIIIFALFLYAKNQDDSYIRNQRKAFKRTIPIMELVRENDLVAANNKFNELISDSAGVIPSKNICEYFVGEYRDFALTKSVLLTLEKDFSQAKQCLDMISSEYKDSTWYSGIPRNVKLMVTKQRILILLREEKLELAEEKIHSTLETIKAIDKIHPTSADFYYLESLLYGIKQQPSNQLISITKAIESDPQHAPAFLLQSKILAILNNNIGAKISLAKWQLYKESFFKRPTLAHLWIEL